MKIQQLQRNYRNRGSIPNMTIDTLYFIGFLECLIKIKRRLLNSSIHSKCHWPYKYWDLRNWTKRVHKISHHDTLLFYFIDYLLSTSVKSRKKCMKTYQSESANQTIRIIINSSTSFGEISTRILALTFETGIEHAKQWSELIRQLQGSKCYLPLFIEIVIIQSDILQVFKKSQSKNLERYRKYFFYALFIDIVDIYLWNWK